MEERGGTREEGGGRWEEGGGHGFAPKAAPRNMNSGDDDTQGSRAAFWTRVYFTGSLVQRIGPVWDGRQLAGSPALASPGR